MEIVNQLNDKYNFAPELQPLFDAMAAGRTIKSITCIKGRMNRDNPELDFKIENFVATEYYVAAGYKHGTTEMYDLVIGSDAFGHRDFYTNLVRCFEL